MNTVAMIQSEMTALYERKAQTEAECDAAAPRLRANDPLFQEGGIAIKDMNLNQLRFVDLSRKCDELRSRELSLQCELEMQMAIESFEASFAT